VIAPNERSTGATTVNNVKWVIGLFSGNGANPQPTNPYAKKLSDIARQANRTKIEPARTFGRRQAFGSRQGK